MSNESASNFLDDVELHQRIETFLAGPLTLEHAADCGLFALAVPPQLGGLLVSQERQQQCVMRLWGIAGKRLVLAIQRHSIFCHLLSTFGHRSQQLTLLPACASGKRVGLWVNVSLDRCEKVSGGYVFDGKVGVPAVAFDYIWIDYWYSLPLVVNGKQVPYSARGVRFLLPRSVIPKIRTYRVLSYLYLDNTFVPDSMEVMPSHEVTPKLEVVR